jgi:hypothetical protein
MNSDPILSATLYTDSNIPLYFQLVSITSEMLRREYWFPAICCRRNRRSAKASA